MQITYAAAAKECRETARKNGMTFKAQPKQTGTDKLYHFIDRSTHRAIIENCTLWNAYENCMSGYVEKMAPAKPTPAPVSSDEKTDMRGKASKKYKGVGRKMAEPTVSKSIRLPVALIEKHGIDGDWLREAVELKINSK